MPEVLTREQVDDELSRIAAILGRKKLAKDPVAWAEDKLHDHLWSGQKTILRTVQKYRRTAVQTCHSIGKSYDAGIIAGWWLDTHEPGKAFCITTAPTQPQVKVILWKEIGRVHTRGQLRGHVNQTEWHMSVGDKDEIVAMGRKPNDYSPTAFNGIHAPFVLVIVDEANGVRGNLWEAFDSLLANDNSKILAIGNPDDPSGEFYDACKPGSGWHVISIGAFDSPNFTGEEMPQSVLDQLIGYNYVEEKRKKWAPSWTWGKPCPSCQIQRLSGRMEADRQSSCDLCGDTGRVETNRCIMPEGDSLENTHPFWQSKILGQFPLQSSTGSLIPLTWIRLAQERTLVAEGVREFGLDVGASIDGDPSCLGYRHGYVFRVCYSDRQPDTMITTGKLIQWLNNPHYGATAAKVDYIGVGRGVVDRCKEQNLPVYPIQVGEKSTILRCKVCKHEWDVMMLSTKHRRNSVRCPKCNSDLTQPVFANLLAQLWWMVRELFEAGTMDIDPNDEELAEELLTIRWEPNSQGQTVVKYADGPSPNRADALLITFAPIPPEQKVDFVSW